MFNKKGIKLGTILYKDDVPYVKGADKRISWRMDEYLATILRDFIRMVEKDEYHIGSAVFGDEWNPLLGKPIAEEGDEELSKKWHDLLKETANMFDTYLIKKDELACDFNFNELLDNAFNNMKKIFMDLWV